MGPLLNSVVGIRKVSSFKMPGDPKLETADELLALFNDPERLKTYKYTQPIISKEGINNEKFHLELPYQQIKEIVERCGAELSAPSLQGRGKPWAGSMWALPPSLGCQEP